MSRDSVTFQSDFDYVRTRVDEFFSRKSIGRALALIDELGITGWEKWWQVEFATWLADHDQIAEWVMEEVFLTDLRTRTAKDTIAIDLGFRMKGYSAKEMLFLELKQNEDLMRCIDNMLKDSEKVYTAQKYSKSNGLMIRNFFVVGIYPTPSVGKKEVHDYIEDKAEARGIPVERQNIFTKFIPESPFSVTVF
jgi:hypothetical protein